MPVPKGISKRLYRHSSQDCCPWNEKFAQNLPAGSPFAARAAFARGDAGMLARNLLAMSEAEYRAAFQGSPMTRAKLVGLKRNSAVALGNIGTPDDVPTLVAALDPAEPLVDEHVAWAIGRADRSQHAGPPDSAR